MKKCYEVRKMLKHRHAANFYWHKILSCPPSTPQQRFTARQYGHCWHGPSMATVTYGLTSGNWMWPRSGPWDRHPGFTFPGWPALTVWLPGLSTCPWSTVHQAVHLAGSAAFNRVGGAIDGYHVQVKPPAEDAACYFNRKLFHSVQLRQHWKVSARLRGILWVSSRVTVNVWGLRTVCRTL